MMQEKGKNFAGAKSLNRCVGMGFNAQVESWS
jgi:hypothetical protein